MTQPSTAPRPKKPFNNFGKGKRGAFKKKTLNANQFHYTNDEDDDEQLELLRKMNEKRKKQHFQKEKLDDAFGFSRLDVGRLDEAHIGWLVNMRTTTVVEETHHDAETNPDYWIHKQPTGMDLYFLGPDFSSFKITVEHKPYIYIRVKKNNEREVEEYLKSLDPEEEMIVAIDLVHRHDLDAPGHLNHSSDEQMSKFMRIQFVNIQALLDIRKVLLRVVQRNRFKRKQHGGSDDMMDPDSDDDDIIRQVFRDEDDDDLPMGDASDASHAKVVQRRNDPAECILDIREYDVHYHVRCAIDHNYRVGYWYNVEHINGDWQIQRLEGPKYEARPDPVICAFDIETTKKKLMFPDHTDTIMMISYMIDGRGFLIVNRDIVSADIENFDYTPKPEYPGEFTVFNVSSEKALLEKWFGHMKEAKPVIYTTFNGDFFDWPFIDARATFHGMSMYEEIGFKRNGDVYESSFGIHMDCFCWVKRDSYLPQGSQGLKKVTAAKLGYKPLEIDPEDMVPFAKDQPVKLAQYSVSDAVATYYLYLKYVHPFIFSLCTLIPMPPDDVLRKGSGTLCESLLMVEAFREEVVFPNRFQRDPEKMYKGHLLNSETYVGGHVESLRSGIYRNDLPQDFELDPTAYQELIDTVDDVLKFSLEVENRTSISEVTNYDEVRSQIVALLTQLRDRPIREELPKIYHLDVGAMYPNIILTNRLQPSAVVDDTICASCVHNNSKSNCKRKMDWTYKAETFSANRSEYLNIKKQLMEEKFPDPWQPGQQVPFAELPREKQGELLNARLSEYSRRAYGRTYNREQVTRSSTVCMRENPFYVDTVQRFRDRRYEYKTMLRTWQDNLSKAENAKVLDDIEMSKKMIVLYDSLQVAHKCILNSFYGYVMRKGARWFSLEMAGIVTYTGAQIIKMARELVDRIGISLELDTDGIWCMLPSIFPENFVFTTQGGKKIKISYPCIVLNQLTHLHFTNDQYQEQKGSSYTISKRCDIFFEVDGPYRAMILPASKEEGKGIKKRYCIYNLDGSLAELKGFEIKRRGELEMIKIMQAGIFDKFLQGKTLEECYKTVGEQANHYLDVLFTQGATVDDETLLNYISESSNMSKTLEEYGESAKSARITTAKRLAELFGEKMIEQAGLKCTYIVSQKPMGEQVSQRCIPTIVFQMEKRDALRYLRKWTQDSNLNSTDIRSIIDWKYYIERVGGSVQKIITIPAALQGVLNPCPRIEHPKWLHKQLADKSSKHKQMNLRSMFSKSTYKENEDEGNILMRDIEDFSAANIASVPVATNKKKRKRDQHSESQTSTISTDVEPFTGGAKQLHDVYKNPKKPLNDEFFENQSFRSWINNQKNRWKKMRTGRSNKGMSTAIGNDMFAAQNDILANSTWQIVEIRESSPGVMKVFLHPQAQHGAAKSKRLFTVLINVPRRIYYNYRSEQPNREPVKNILPRSQASPYLYMLEMHEEAFINSWEGADSNDSHLLGVYETNVPLTFQSLISLGGQCKVRPESRSKVGTNQLSIDDLMRTVSGEYTDMCSELEKVFLYTSFSDTRGIVGVFFYETKVAEIFTIQPYDERPKLNMHKIHDRILKEHLGSNRSQDEMLPLYEFRHRYVPDRATAFQHVQRLMQNYKRTSAISSVVLCHSPLNKDQLCAGVPALLDYPIIMMSSTHNDANFQLEWIRKCTEALFEKFVTVEEWYTRQVNYSRYANVPVCNLEPDVSMQLIDLLFARVLRSKNHILWISPTLHPDLGGLEDEDYSFSRMQRNVEINKSGFHYNVCVELDLAQMELNSIIQSDTIQELEGMFQANTHRNDLSDLQQHFPSAAAASAAALRKAPQVYDENVLCADAFFSLRDMIMGLYADIGDTDDAQIGLVIDSLRSNIHRWLQNSKALLYDPALSKMVFNLMLKVFARLLITIRKLGIEIIHATFNKLVLRTPKDNLADAKEHIQLLQTYMHKQRLFSWISVNDIRYWSHLVWMDSSNYCGVLLYDADENRTLEQPDGYWSIAKHVPSEVGDCFIERICDYVHNLYKDEKNDSMRQNQTPSKGDNDENLCMDQLLENLRRDSSRKYIDVMMKKALKKIVRQLSEHELQPMPVLPGTTTGGYLEVKRSANHALTLITSICHVLSYNEHIKQDVLLMKEKLLKRIGVANFTTESEFHKPTTRYVLPDVICLSCSHTRNMDFCSDRDLLDNSTRNWECSHCHHSYNKELIEDRLIEDLHQKISSHEMQDLKCHKCSSVKEDNMQERCCCAGQYTTVKRRIKEDLHVLLSIAEYYHFDLLRESVEFMLRAEDE